MTYLPWIAAAIGVIALLLLLSDWCRALEVRAPLRRPSVGESICIAIGLLGWWLLS